MTRIWPYKMLALKKCCDDYFAVESYDPIPLSDVDSQSITLLRQRVASAKSVDQVVMGNRGWEIHATFDSLSEHCPSCGGALTQHSWSNSTVLDAPFKDKHVRLHVKRPRFQCRSCKVTLTPIVHGILEGSRVTDGLVDYIKHSLWTSSSLRNLASSVGALPKTIADLLKRIAEESRQEIAVPIEIGIHELSLSGQRHLLLSNVALGSVVDFLPSVDDQVDQLGHRLFGFNQYAPTQVVTVPADRAIVETTASNCSSARIELSLEAFRSLIAQVVSKLGSQESKQGKIGSISSSESYRLAHLRKVELSREEAKRFDDGLFLKNPFWKLYDAKEQLLNSFEGAPPMNWVNLFSTWIQNLPLRWQPSFHGPLLFLVNAQKLHLSFTHESRQPLFDANIRTLQAILSKPGKSFSPEMLSAMFLASPYMSIPLVRKFGRKGAGPIWVEEAMAADISIEPSTAGVSLDSLVKLLNSLEDPNPWLDS